MIRLVRKDTPCHGITVPSIVQSSELSTLGVSSMKSNVFGIDIAKQVFINCLSWAPSLLKYESLVDVI